MIVAVTGGTGFIGLHLVKLLSSRGYRVRILARPESRIDLIESNNLEVYAGDIRDPHSIKDFIQGADIVFHTAADYRLWCENTNDIFETNVFGTENILRAAINSKVGKVVYTSTVGCLGIPKDKTIGNEEKKKR